MIYLYSGTPGSGKSLHMARDILSKLRRKQNVICNFPINLDIVQMTRIRAILLFLIKLFRLKIDLKDRFKRKIGTFVYKPDRDLTVAYLVSYAKMNHVVGKEGQTLLIVDECQRIWNSSKNRISKKEMEKWEDFFSLHRHLGYNIILATQKDRMIDRYLRDLLEYDVVHRKANNFGSIGMFIPFKLFVAITRWYGINQKCGSEYFTYNKKHGQLYDSYARFEHEEEPKKENENDDETEKDNVLYLAQSGEETA